MRTWRRKCVPGIRSRWRRCHQSLRSASVGAARIARAKRRCGATIVRSRFAQTRGSPSADMSSRSYCYPHPLPTRGRGAHLVCRLNLLHFGASRNDGPFSRRCAAAPVSSNCYEMIIQP